MVQDIANISSISIIEDEQKVKGQIIKYFFDSRSPSW